MRLNANGAVLNRKQHIDHLGIHMTDIMCYEEEQNQKYVGRPTLGSRCYPNLGMLVCLQNTPCYIQSPYLKCDRELLHFTAHSARG